MTNSKYSSEGGSDRETNEDEDDFAFEYLEADTSESFKQNPSSEKAVDANWESKKSRATPLYQKKSLLTAKTTASN